MSRALSQIEILPGTLAEFVSGICRTNRVLALEGWSRTRRRHGVPLEAYTVRTSTIHLRAYLTRSHQNVFLFFNGPTTTKAILEVEEDFDVMPSVEDEPPAELPSVTITILLPPFLLDLPSEHDEAVLASKLGADTKTLVFVHLEDSWMAIADIEKGEGAKVGWMQEGATSAGIAYHHTFFGGAHADDAHPFLLLLDLVEDWTRSNFLNAREMTLSGGRFASEGPAARILQAMIDVWTECTKAAVDCSQDPFDRLRPTLDVRNLRGSLMLRLAPTGEIAENDVDDDFRLTVLLQMEVSAPNVRIARFTAGPPDFLLDGDLHDLLVQAVLTDDDALDRIFGGMNLADSEKAQFIRFLQADSVTALVFRIQRQGDQDRDLLAFDGDWNGQHRQVIISAGFEVKQKVDGWDVTLMSDGDQGPKVEFSSLTTPNRMDPTLPQYLFRLVWQLMNWRKSLE